MPTTSDFLIDRLLAWGVRRIYGYPGDGINGIIGALHRAESRMQFIQVRHEEQAAFMACAHAKWTGELGVCLATSGPGAIHLLNGLYDAKSDHAPVLAIVGQAATTALGGEYQQEVDLNVLFKDVASDYLTSVVSPGAMRHAVDRAARTAIAHRTVTAIIIPKDIQEKPAVEKEPHKHNTIHSGVGYRRPRIIPHEDDLRAAAEVLNAGQKVAMLVGSGARGAEDAIVAVAEKLGAGCAKALLGKDVLADDYPWVTGTIGLLGTRASNDMMRHCDTLLMVGSNFPYSEFLPKEGQARGVQIDVDGKRISLRYPMEVNLIGDARDTLEALLPLLHEKTDRSWQQKIENDRKGEVNINASRAAVSANPINPELIFEVLSPRLPDNVVLTGDAGTSTNFLARHLHMKRGMRFSLSGGLATMGGAVPYAIAAKFAFPDRPAIALTGDGAMQMNGINEMLTVARYWKTWSDPRLIFMVNDNQDLNQVTWEMRIETGIPTFPASQSLPPFPYAKYAELIGFTGIFVDDPNDLGAAWDNALAADRPVILQIMTDASVSILPPHISFEQAQKFTLAALKGDADEGGMITESVKSVIAGMIPMKNPSDVTQER